MPPDDQPTQPRQSALSGRLLQGATLMVAMRWVMRLLGLVNIAVLARLLVPADFGVVAMAMVAVGVADEILNIGIDGSSFSAATAIISTTAPHGRCGSVKTR